MALDDDVAAMSQSDRGTWRSQLKYFPEFIPIIGAVVSSRRHRRGESTVYTHPNEAARDVTSTLGVISQLAGYVPLLIFTVAAVDTFFSYLSR